jgi:hypothetical protein
VEAAIGDVSIADILGPWVDPHWDSGLIDRCKNAWNKPLRNLSNDELATLLRQRVAVKHLLPIAKKRTAGGVEDGTETHEGELQAAVDYAGKTKC